MNTNDCTIIKIDDISISQPDDINIILKQHQLKLVYKCLELELGVISHENDNITINTKIGIIGDRVGAGKSYSCLALTTFPIHSNIDKTTIHSSNEFSITKTKDVNLFKNINIIVIPFNIFNQWKTYIEDNTSITAEYAKTRNNIANLTYTTDIILISSSIYNDFADLVVNEFKYYFARVFFDEADSLKIPNCRRIDAQFYWFVTASINNLLHPNGYHCGSIDYPGICKKGFIKNTFKNMMDASSEFKKYIYLKNSDELIDLSFALPKPNVIMIKCKNTKMIHILSNMISEDIQQMICANDIQGAIRAMNVDQTSEDNLIKIIANGLFDDIENKKVDLDAIQKKIYRNANKQLEDINKIKTEISDLERKIKTIQDRIKETNMDPITYDDIINPTIVKCCTQVFNFESITSYITTTNSPKCPMCRTPITKSSLLVVNNNLTYDDEETKTDIQIDYNYEEYEKDDNLTYLLSNKMKPNARIMIFSEYCQSFNNICNNLQNSVEYKMLKGCSTTVDKTLKWFAESSQNIKILLLNAQYCGAGLNIQITTDIIIYHKMNRELEEQVIGRSNRIGRTGILNVWKLQYNAE